MTSPLPKSRVQSNQLVNKRSLSRARDANARFELSMHDVVDTARKIGLVSQQNATRVARKGASEASTGLRKSCKRLSCCRTSKDLRSRHGQPKLHSIEIYSTESATPPKRNPVSSMSLFDKPIQRADAVPVDHRRRLLHELRPQLANAHSSGGKHAVLKAVEVLAVDWRHKLTAHETEEDTRRDVVLPDTVAQLEILMEHCFQRQRNRLT